MLVTAAYTPQGYRLDVTQQQVVTLTSVMPKTHGLIAPIAMDTGREGDVPQTLVPPVCLVPARQCTRAVTTLNKAAWSAGSHILQAATAHIQDVDCCRCHVQSH